MSKKSLPVLVLGAFILLIFIAVYLFINLRNREITTKTPLTSTEIDRISQEPADQIKKSVPPDGQTIIYEIEGKMAGELTRQGILLRGNIIIRDDPLQRKIPLYLGAVDSTTPFGSYIGSFRGDSTWVKTPLQTVAKEIGPEESVIILVQYPITGSDQDLKTRKHEEILDSLIAEFKKEEFSYEIPSDFELSAARIGVVR